MTKTLKLATTLLLITSALIGADTIDDQINQLSIKIQENRKASLNAEIEAQTFLPVEWNKYSEKIRESEQHENEALALEKKLSLLLEKKKATQSTEK
jgi:hypothetical protein